MNELVHKKRLFIGFVTSLVCTLVVYVAVTNAWFSEYFAAVLFVLIIGLAQALIQARYFLHFDEESKPRWQFHSFWFTALMVVVIVVGSIWVMLNLNYNMGMSPEQMNQYMLKQNKKGF